MKPWATTFCGASNGNGLSGKHCGPGPKHMCGNGAWPAMADDVIAALHAVPATQPVVWSVCQPEWLLSLQCSPDKRQTVAQVLAITEPVYARIAAFCATANRWPELISYDIEYDPKDIDPSAVDAVSFALCRKYFPTVPYCNFGLRCDTQRPYGPWGGGQLWSNNVLYGEGGGPKRGPLETFANQLNGFSLSYADSPAVPCNAEIGSTTQVHDGTLIDGFVAHSLVMTGGRNALLFDENDGKSGPDLVARWDKWTDEYLSLVGDATWVRFGGFVAQRDAAKRIFSVLSHGYLSDGRLIVAAQYSQPTSGRPMPISLHGVKQMPTPTGPNRTTMAVFAS